MGEVTRPLFDRSGNTSQAGLFSSASWDGSSAVDISALPPDSTKYQVVVRADEIDKGLPLYLKTRYAFHAPASKHDQKFREELVKELLDLPLDPTLETMEFAL